MASDPAKQILEYAEPTKGRVFFSKSAFVAGCVMAGVMLFTLCFATPRFEMIFRDFGTELPAMTKVWLSISRIVQTGGWIAIAIAPIVLGFIAALLPQRLRDAPKSSGGRKRRSRAKLATMLFLILFLGVTVMSLILPLINLVHGVSGSQGK